MRTNAAEQKEERLMLLEAWKEMEEAAGVNGDAGSVEKKMPKRVKRKRPITLEDGTHAGYVTRARFPHVCQPLVRNASCFNLLGGCCTHMARMMEFFFAVQIRGILRLHLS